MSPPRFGSFAAAPVRPETTRDAPASASARGIAVRCVVIARSPLRDGPRAWRQIRWSCSAIRSSSRFISPGKFTDAERVDAAADDVLAR